MKFRQIGYFIAVAEEQNFSRAAQRIGIEQSPLSRAIRALETDIGVSLLERTTRGSKLTPAGEAFLHYARSIVASTECARRAARAVANLRSEIATTKR
jgi:DNA-binding transcriptional LysR family regulator